MKEDKLKNTELENWAVLQQRWSLPLQLRLIL